MAKNNYVESLFVVSNAGAGEHVGIQDPSYCSSRWCRLHCTRTVRTHRGRVESRKTGNQASRAVLDTWLAFEAKKQAPATKEKGNLKSCRTMPPSDILDHDATAPGETMMKDPLELVHHQNERNRHDPFDRSVSTKAAPHPYIPQPSGKRSTGLPPYVPKLRQQYHKATLELPLQYKNKAVALQPRARLNLDMSFPLWSKHSHANQLLECELSGVSALRGRTGYSTGSAGLRFTNTDTDRKTTTLTANVGSLGVYQEPHTEHQGDNSTALQLGIMTMAPKTGLALSTCFNFPKPTNDPARCTLSLAANRRFHVSRLVQPVKFGSHLSTNSIQNPIALDFVIANAPVAVSATKRQRWELRLGFSRPTTSSGSNIQTASPSLRPSIRLFLSPPQKLSSKLLDFSAFWKAGSGWGLGGMWRYKTSGKSRTDRELRVGAIWNVSTKTNSLSWVFAWTEGDCTLRVPILISRTASTAMDFYRQQSFQFLYLSLLSRIIQDIIGSMFPPSSETNDERPHEQVSLRSRQQKARKDALQQQSFMARQARIRMKAEKDQNGLIILRAIYYIRDKSESLNDENSFDVTVPIQFWVNDSKLQLFEVSKRGSMLGFYDITAFVSSDEGPSEDFEKTSANNSARKSDKNWMGRMLSLLWDRNNQSPLQTSAHAEEPPTAALAVWYTYGGSEYNHIFGDDEEILLPSLCADRN